MNFDNDGREEPGLSGLAEPANVALGITVIRPSPLSVRFVPQEEPQGETHMRHILSTAAAFILVASVAFAQAPAQNGRQNPAVKSMGQNNSSVPVAGANSFTMGEAKSRSRPAATPMSPSSRRTRAACGVAWQARTASPAPSASITRAT